MAWPFAGSSEQFEGHRYFLVKNSLRAAQHLILSPNTKKQVVVDSCTYYTHCQSKSLIENVLPNRNSCAGKEPNEQYVMAYKDKLKSRYNEPHVRLNLPDIAEYCRILVDEDWTFLSTIGAQQTVAMQKEDESWQDAINAAVKKRSKQRKAASEYVLAHEEAEEYMVRMPVMPLLPSISAVNQIVYSRSIHRPMPVRCLAIFVARALHRTTIHQFCDFFR